MPLSQQLLANLHEDQDVTIFLQTLDETDIKNLIEAMKKNKSLLHLRLLENTLPSTSFKDIAEAVVEHPTLTTVIVENNKYSSQSLNTKDPIQQDPKIGENFLQILINEKSTLKGIKKLTNEIVEKIQTANTITKTNDALSLLKKSLDTIYNTAIEFYQTENQRKPKKDSAKKSILKPKNNKPEAKSFNTTPDIYLTQIWTELLGIDLDNLNQTIKILNDNQQINIEEIISQLGDPKSIRERRGKLKIKIGTLTNTHIKKDIINELNHIIKTLSTIKMAHANKDFNATTIQSELIFPIKDCISIIDEIEFIAIEDIIDDLTRDMSKINNLKGTAKTQLSPVFTRQNSKMIFPIIIKNLEDQKSQIKRSFIEYLEKNLSKIEYLQLGTALDNNWGIDQSDGEFLIKHLESHNKLIQFKLTHTTISEPTLITLAQQLLDPIKFPNLKVIDLSNNDLGASFIAAIADMVPNHPHLTQLILKGNAADFVTRREFLKNLTKNNYYLVNIDVSNNKGNPEEQRQITILQLELANRNKRFAENKPNLLESYKVGSQLLREIASQKKLAATNLDIIQGMKEKRKKIKNLEGAQLDKSFIERPLYPFELALRSSKEIMENLQEQLKQNRQTMRKSLIGYITQASQNESFNILKQWTFMKSALQTLKENSELIDKNNEEDQTTLLNFFKKVILTALDYQSDIIATVLPANEQQKPEAQINEGYYDAIEKAKDTYTLSCLIKDLKVIPDDLLPKEIKTKKSPIKTKVANPDANVQEKEKKIADLFSPIKNYIEEILETLQPFVIEPRKEEKETKRFTKIISAPFVKSGNKKTQTDKNATSDLSPNKSADEEWKPKQEFRTYLNKEVSPYPKFSSYAKTLFSEATTESSKNSINQRPKKKKFQFNPEVKELHSYYYHKKQDEEQNAPVAHDAEVNTDVADSKLGAPLAAIHEEITIPLDELDREHDETKVFWNKLGNPIKQNSIRANQLKDKKEPIIESLLDSDESNSNQP